MPPEWADHERTLMAWPCRRELWGSQLARACEEYAATANAIAAFEPVTMVCAGAADAAAARTALSAAVAVVELPIDDSWLRDSGPIFVIGAEGRRAGVHFGFNAWGEKFHPFHRDAAVGAALVTLVGDPLYRAPFVLEGGSIAVDGAGTLITTEQCLLHPNRNPGLARVDVEAGLRRFLGVEHVVWLGEGLLEDRDTDGHVDLVAAFVSQRRVLLLVPPHEDPNHAAMRANRERLEAAEIEVIEFPVLAEVDVAGERAVCSYLNFYVLNGAVVVPQAGAPSDAEALERIAAVFPGREVVGVPGAVVAWGGGGVHCITQQVPARS